MKYHYLSDLHIDHRSARIQKFIPELTSEGWEPGSNTLIIAGDITPRMTQLKLFISECSAWFKDVIVALGNHDYVLEGVGADGLLRRHMKDMDFSNVHILTPGNVFENDEAVFFGGTMWTDYGGRDKGNMGLAKMYMPELNYLYIDDLCDEHDTFIAALEAFDQHGYEGKLKICVTHHLPNEDSIDPEYEHSLLNTAFQAGVPDRLVGKFDLWIHGHTHKVMEHYTCFRVLVLCNPYGYQFECDGFRPRSFTIENRFHLKEEDSHLYGDFETSAAAMRYVQTLNREVQDRTVIDFHKAILTQEGEPIK